MKKKTAGAESRHVLLNWCKRLKIMPPFWNCSPPPLLSFRTLPQDAALVPLLNQSVI